MNDEQPYQGFNPTPLIIIVLVTSLSVALMSNWYSNNVSMPRYCDDPETAIFHLKELMTKDRPAGDNSRIPYLIAAKLLFILPQGGEEPLDSYLQRVRLHIAQQCRVS
ncbi:MAG: hypothetical protein OEL79_04405 [Chromatiales bacterium]|nr:hypothetical protein [Chromatiales bacterium]